MLIKKKIIIIFSVFGFLMLLVGVLFTPSVLSKFTSSGEFRSDWTVAQIYMIRYILVLTGAFSFLTSIFLLKKNENERIKFLIKSWVIFSITFIGISIIYSPSFIEENFTSIKILEDHNLTKLIYIQLVLITVGFILLSAFLFIYRKKFLNAQKSYGKLIIVLIAGAYFVVLSETFLKLRYPANIILKPKEYWKLLDLVLGQDILLSEFEPRSTLVVERKIISKAKYPVIDINVHLNSMFQTEEDRKVLSPENLLKAMDSVGVKIIVNTDGTINGYNNLEEALNLYSRKYPDRFITFYPSWFPPIIVTDEFLADLPNMLEKAVKLGVKGNGETWKEFGLRTRDVSGKVIPVDDPRIDPLWEKAAELKVPVLWHMGDPAPMFQPVDRFNERYIELRRYPQWSYYGPRFPSRETILKGRENVIKKHPNTIFIGCHMGWNSDNLAYAAYLLDTYPNYYLDMSTTLSELGRQPYTARKFFIKYQDRILFGTDGGAMFGQKGWTVERFYQAHFEFLETENEYIDYPMQGAINQGSWKIYGINLPDSVLQKIYYKNAEKLLNIKVDANQN